MSDPEPTGESWIDAMRSGNFAGAWAVADRDLATLRLADPAKHAGPRHLQRIWRGEELRDKHVLVRCYHGLGDTIQFIRFMPPLRRIARRVTVWCQPELLPIVRLIEGVDNAIPLHDGTPDEEFDVDIEVMEVPHAIKVARSEVEIETPYIRLPPNSTATLPEHRCALAVGLVWEVGQWDKRRAIPAGMLRRLSIEGVDLCSLQRGEGAVGRHEAHATDISTADICQLGRLLQQLDLLICVDTMVAHLAGALGRRAWVLLHSDCDWRWPTRGSSTFWYPSLRLFHQQSPGNWADVIEEVRLALAEQVQVRTVLSLGQQGAK